MPDNTKIQEIQGEVATIVYEEAGQDWDECCKAAARIMKIIQTQRKEAEEKNMRLEGLRAIVKFIRNKARRDIMKADLYGQGYYQAIKDLEDYVGINQLSTQSTEGENNE